MLVNAVVDSARKVLLVKPPMAAVVKAAKSWLSMAMVWVLLKPAVYAVVNAAACAVVSAAT